MELDGENCVLEDFGTDEGMSGGAKYRVVTIDEDVTENLLQFVKVDFMKRLRGMGSRMRAWRVFENVGGCALDIFEFTVKETETHDPDA